MTKQKYDPLIFGSVDIERRPRMCGGKFVRDSNLNPRNDEHSLSCAVVLCCNRCGDICQLSLASYTVARMGDLTCKKVLHD